jgi:hypothetical protein
MRIVELSLFPTSIDVTLHKYNYIDNKLWVQIKNQLDYIEVDDFSIIITKQQLQVILVEHYSNEINKIKSTGSKFFHNQVNTIYFVWMFIEEMSNLQYIKLTLNSDKSYSRLLINEDGDKSIEFDFKLLSITIRLTDIFELNEVAVINQMLNDLNLLQFDETYIRLRALDLINSVDNYLAELDDEDELEESTATITDFLELFNYKIERDNPLTLLVTDY